MPPTWYTAVLQSEAVGVGAATAGRRQRPPLHRHAPAGALAAAVPRREGVGHSAGRPGQAAVAGAVPQLLGLHQDQLGGATRDARPVMAAVVHGTDTHGATVRAQPQQDPQNEHGVGNRHLRIERAEADC